MTEKSVYQQQGFQNRKEYLISVSEEYGAPLDAVFMLATMLGPNEDFDGLITTLEDEFGY